MFIYRKSKIYTTIYISLTKTFLGTSFLPSVTATMSASTSSTVSMLFPTLLSFKNNRYGLLNDDGMFLDDWNFHRDVFGYWNWDILLDVDDIGLGNLNLNGHGVWFVDNIWLGNVHDVRLWNLDDMMHGVWFLYWNLVWYWYFLRNMHCFVNGVILVHDMGNWIRLGYRYGFVHWHMLRYMHDVWNRHGMWYRVGFVDLLDNHCQFWFIMTMMMPSVSSSLTVSNT